MAEREKNLNHRLACSAHFNSQISEFSIFKCLSSELYVWWCDTYICVHSNHLPMKLERCMTRPSWILGPMRVDFDVSCVHDMRTFWASSFQERGIHGRKQSSYFIPRMGCRDNRHGREFGFWVGVFKRPVTAMGMHGDQNFKTGLDARSACVR